MTQGSPDNGEGPGRPHTRLARLTRAVAWATPGQLDAGLASLASFAVGLAAVRDLETGGLAAYALLISAYQVMNQIPAQLVFSPSQILAVDLPVGERLGALAHSVPRGALFSVLSALLVPFGALLVASEVPTSDLIALSSSAALLAIVSPIQDHVRAVFHMSRLSWMAAAMSAVNLGGTGVTLALVYSSISWAVFGSLFVGNSLSLALGAYLVRRQRVAPPEKPTMRHLYWLGGWLLWSGLGKTSIGYGVNALLSVFAGITALGYVQGARVVAQPINVFSKGLMSQVGPNLTEAASRRSISMARRWSKRFVVLLGIASVSYLLAVAVPWFLNPFSAIAPRAYEVPGLVAGTLLVASATAYMRSLRLQMLGARLQKVAALVTILTGLVELGLVTSGALVGAYAAPLAVGAATLLAIVWYSSRLRDVYGQLDSAAVIDRATRDV